MIWIRDLVHLLVNLWLYAWGRPLRPVRPLPRRPPKTVPCPECGEESWYLWRDLHGRPLYECQSILELEDHPWFTPEEWRSYREER